MKDMPLMIDEKTELHIGDYFRAFRSKYYISIKDIIENQRNWENRYGEYYTTMYVVDIFDKKENLLATNSIVTLDRIKSGALAKYIPNLRYDPTYLGITDVNEHYVEYKIWKDMTRRCFDCTDPVFPYIGAVGTTVCDRWRCFEYFLSDFKHIEGYAEAGNNINYKHYIIDLYDIQKHIHPSNRIYAPGYVKLKPFKESDIRKYYNIAPHVNNYPKDIITTARYRSHELDIKETLFKKQTGVNVNIDLDNACYYYNSEVGYQPLVTMVNPYMTYAHIVNYNRPMKEMCTIIRKE